MDPNELVGQQIDRYLIKEHIDRGGMADVYLAYEADLDRYAAFKVILPAYAHDKELLARFDREGQSTAHIIHPNVIQVYATGITPSNQPYLAMEYCERGTLENWLDKVAAESTLLPTSVALALVRQIADALRVVHSTGIVHRDLKPSNILLRRDGTPVLTDLGIAATRVGTRLTQTGSLLGTAQYMSPEQASGKPVDGRSDLYSLGIILYELLAGRRPFDAEESLAVLHKQIYEEPPKLQSVRPGLSGQLYAIVQRSMQKDPNKRFQNAQELVLALDQVLDALGVTEEVSSPGIWRPFIAGTGLLSRQQVLREVRVADGSKNPTKVRPLYIILPVILVAILFFLLNSRNSSQPPEPTLVVITAEPATVVVITLTPKPINPNQPTLPKEPTEETPTNTPTATATNTPTPTPTPTESAAWIPEQLTIGRSVSNAPIEVVKFGNGPSSIVFIGGLHAGFAPGTVELAKRAVTHFTLSTEEIPDSVTLYVVISVNLDSRYSPGELGGRLNDHGVDLNRNWDCRWTQNAQFRGQVVPGSGGTSPFSEPETRSLADFLQGADPVAVVIWEARAIGGLVSPGDCDGTTPASAPLAGLYGQAAGYNVADFEDLTNQTLNGDSTNWLDKVGIPAIAVLLPQYTSTDWNNNLAGMRAILREHAE